MSILSSRNHNEIDDILKECDLYHSPEQDLSYSDGVAAALLWMTGETDEHPMDVTIQLEPKPRC